MASIFTQIRTAAAKRAAYNRTVAEISAMDSRLAIEDLGIATSEARQIAKRAVYGA